LLQDTTHAGRLAWDTCRQACVGYMQAGLRGSRAGVSSGLREDTAAGQPIPGYTRLYEAVLAGRAASYTQDADLQPVYSSCASLLPRSVYGRGACLHRLQRLLLLAGAARAAATAARRQASGAAPLPYGGPSACAAFSRRRERERPSRTQRHGESLVWKRVSKRVSSGENLVSISIGIQPPHTLGYRPTSRRLPADEPYAIT
jgi:hypothetical protein